MQTHEIAALEKLPAYFLSTIMTRLRQYKVVRSSTGAKGGFKLARSPQRIRIIDIVHALESGPNFGEARHDGRGSPGKAIVMRLDRIMTGQINESLKGLTLADLIANIGLQREDGDALMYHI
jgi:Rrf2 family protein